MPARSGTAMLPLHGGALPPWLAERMAKLGRIIVEAIVLEYGRDEVLRRLAHPFWFQSFGAVMGMDWHSSGITTTVTSALKKGLAPIEHEIGLHVCGGRGKESRKTPGELLAIGERTGLDGTTLARTSRLVAKVDGAAVQDGFELYHHAFVVTDDGKWTVVQQGMNASTRTARRYHWLSEDVKSFVHEPHAAIDGRPLPSPIVNLVDARAERSRDAQLDLVRDPERVLRELGRSHDDALATLPHLDLPAHHDVRREDVSLRRLGGALRAANEADPSTYDALLLTPGLGARTLFALAHVAEVLHGAPCRFSDPARFSLAHGGKDGHPYPVPLRVYDDTLRVLRDAVSRAKLGESDRIHALRALGDQARSFERTIEDVDFDRFVEHERDESHRWGGMTVMGPARPRPRAKPATAAEQLSLFSPRAGKPR